MEMILMLRMSKRRWLSAAAAVILLIVMLVIGFGGCGDISGVFRGGVGTGWGLAFGAEGTQPQGPISAEELRAHDAYYIGKSEEKTIYLTFDAGYENGYTAGLLDILKDKQVPAAFFLVGHYLESSPDLVRRMLQEGHVVGNHTMRHLGMQKLQDTAIFQKEMGEFEALFQSVTGVAPAKIYRPPEGTMHIPNLDQAKALGYRTYFWSCAYADWDNRRQPDPGESLALLKTRMHPGCVLLLHSTSATNVQILGDLIDWCKAQGYTFAPLTALA